MSKISINNNNNNNSVLSNSGNSNSDNFSEKNKQCCLHCIDANLLDNISKANLFILCCVAACFSLITYLAAFSCEVSWLLESHGDLPTAAHLLCAGYFILFVASTILIHGLATGLSWGLFSWSIVIGVMSIPELIFVMYMTTQYWGLQSTHGLTELIGYLIRLVVNCLALLCVIPTGLRWRREQQVLNQLQSLASRLQLSTPLPGSPLGTDASITSTDSNNRKMRNGSRRNSAGIDNHGYIQHENNSIGSQNIMQSYPYNIYGSQNEFNASVFGLNASQYIGPPCPPTKQSKKTQSLLDLRYLITGHHHNRNQDMQTQSQSLTSDDQSDLNNKNINLNNNNNNTIMNNHNNKELIIDNNNENYDDNTLKKKKLNNEKLFDPIYYTIDNNNKQQQLSRNCISLENLGGIETINKNMINTYGNNLLQHYYNQQQQMNFFNQQQQQQQQQQQLHDSHNYIKDKQMLQQQYYFTPNLQFNNSCQHIMSPQMQQQQPYYNYQQYNQQQQQQQHLPFGYSYFNHNLLNPYLQNNSQTNSRQSLGNESDDYRKYRDVAL